MTATATIEVKYVNPPKNNPKASWSIKDALGAYWGFYPEKVGKPSPGDTITVEWSESNYQGKTYKNIEKILTVGTAPDSNSSAPASSPRPAQQDDRTPERIFVCGIINAAIHSGALQPFNAGDIAAVGQAAQEAYAQLFGGK
jgi:hypothetical protein